MLSKKERACQINKRPEVKEIKYVGKIKITVYKEVPSEDAWNYLHLAVKEKILYKKK